MDYQYTKGRSHLVPKAALDGLNRVGSDWQSMENTRTDVRHENKQSSSSADSVIQSELRKSEVGHEWNTMKQQRQQ